MSGMKEGKKEIKKEEGVIFIRTKRGGKRLEVAAYKDKLPTDRTKEALAKLNLLDVLQVEKVFANAAKGDVVKRSDLVKIFCGTGKNEVKIFDDNDELERNAILYVLEKGDIQTDDSARKESSHEVHDVIKSIASAVALKVINPGDSSEGEKSKKKQKKAAARWTPEDIERELKNIKFHPLPDKDASVLEAIKAIHAKGTIDIQRVQTKLCFKKCDEGEVRALKACADKAKGYALVIRQSPNEIEILVDPDHDVFEDLKNLGSGAVMEVAKDHDPDEGDLTLEGASGGTESADDKKKKKKKKKDDDDDHEKPRGGKKKEKEKEKDDEDDEEDDEPPQMMLGKKAKKGGMAAPSKKKDDDEGDLKSMLAKLGLDDDDDDDGGKKGGKKKGKRK